MIAKYAVASRLVAIENQLIEIRRDHKNDIAALRAEISSLTQTVRALVDRDKMGAQYVAWLQTLVAKAKEKKNETQPRSNP